MFDCGWFFICVMYFCIDGYKGCVCCEKIVGEIEIGNFFDVFVVGMKFVVVGKEGNVMLCLEVVKDFVCFGRFCIGYVDGISIFFVF